MTLNYKHIIWDWNGTLFNDLDLCVNIINGVLLRRGLPELSTERYKDIFTFPVKDYYAEAGLDFSKESFELLGKEWMDEYETRKHECGPDPYAESVLKKLSAAGIDQSILSAYTQDSLREIVKRHKLEKYFSHLVGLDNIYAAGKIELGRNLIKVLGLDEGDSVLIGDTVHDHEVAVEIGAHSILVASGHQSYNRLAATGAKVFHSMRELYQSL